MTRSDVQPVVGAFGAYGGRYSSELLMPALEELARACRDILPSQQFQRQMRKELRRWAGRPTPITEVPGFANGTGLRLFLKREDLLHGGAHKTNNVTGQGLLARFLGKPRLIADQRPDKYVRFPIKYLDRDIRIKFQCIVDRSNFRTIGIKEALCYRIIRYINI